jgi:hypothetical protein
LAGGIISEFREMGKFPAPALAHRVSKPWLKIAENRKGCPLPHSSPMNNSGICGDSDTIAMPACSADSVVRVGSRVPNGWLPTASWFCRKAMKAVAGNAAEGFASRSTAAKRRRLALIGKAFGQGAAEMGGRLRRIIRKKAHVVAG